MFIVGLFPPLLFKFGVWSPERYLAATLHANVAFAINYSTLKWNLELIFKRGGEINLKRIHLRTVMCFTVGLL